MPRIKGKVYAKPQKRDPKKPKWENGLECVKEGKPWSKADIAWNLERKTAGWSYKAIQRALLRSEQALRLKVMQARRKLAEQATNLAPSASPAPSPRAGSKRAGKKAVKSSRSVSSSSGSSSAPSAAVKASPAASPPASKAPAADPEDNSGFLALIQAAKIVGDLPEASASATTRTWPHSANKCAISYITN